MVRIPIFLIVPLNFVDEFISEDIISPSEYLRLNITNSPPNRFVRRVLCDNVSPAIATPLKAPNAVGGTRILR